MHGLINRAVQCFLRDTYGPETWARVAEAADAPAAGFEAMFVYDDAVTVRMLAAAARVLDRPAESVEEDLGTYLVTHRDLEPLRRLLRFGGETFGEFLGSLSDLPRRAALALPDLVLPDIRVSGGPDGAAVIAIRRGPVRLGHVLAGMLRTLADDYGALVLLDHDGERDGAEWLRVRILSTDHAEGRPFQLAAGL